MTDARTTINKNEEKDPLLQEVIDNLENFIENINCIHETFGYSKGTLSVQQMDSLKRYDEFVSGCTISEEDGKKYVNVPEGKKGSFLN